MKKLMFAAAIAAMGAGAYADLCSPDEESVARVYQMQMNVYTTKGVATGSDAGSICEPGTGACLNFRGKDKTVIRGYIYTCANLCKFDDYEEGFVDSKRKALFGEIEDGNFTAAADLSWRLLNFMGASWTDVECAWDFTGTVTYDAARAQTYTLVGAGYGVKGSGTTIFADKMKGYFAGTVTAPYDLTSNDSCACEPSKILTCDGYDSLSYEDADSIAFGQWKIRFNANVSKAYLAGNWNVATALKKIMQ